MANSLEPSNKNIRGFDSILSKRPRAELILWAALIVVLCLLDVVGTQ